MLAALVFLTPLGGLVALAAVLPLAALALGGRRVRAVRASLGLMAPPARRLVPSVLALVAVPALLGLAAAQPALRRPETARVRTDAEAMFVIDISRSMLASRGAGRPTRLTRAKHDAILLRGALSEIPSGVATFTDRVLPALLPSPDLSSFDLTMQHAVAIEQPPPSSANVTATTLGALGVLGTGNYFPASARKRLVVVLTDGESRPFDAGAVAHALSRGPGIKVVLVHVSSPGEAVYDGPQLEQGYHEGSASGEALAMLAAATKGAVVGENSLATAIGDAKSDLGTGPTTPVTRVERTQSLAPFVVLLACVWLVALAALREWRGFGSLAVRRRHDSDVRQMPSH